MPECPICKEELEFVDNFDFWVDGDIIEMKSLGKCPKCGKEYKWKDLYTYSHFTDLREA